MERVKSLQDYYLLVRTAKERYKRLTTNNYLYPNAVERYIQLERFYVEENDAGILFFSDEETYYQAYYYVNHNAKFRIKKGDKTIVLQNIYTENAKRKEIMEIEKSLQDSGMTLKSRLRHGTFEGWDKWKALQKAAAVSERMMEQTGLRYAPADIAHLHEVMAFAKTIREIPFYQFPYFTKEEYINEASERRLCCITDREGKVVAARHLIVSGNKTYGWVGIEEEYQKAYGMAILILCHDLDYVHSNHLKMCSWVDEKNTVSLRYHERIGTIWTGHLEDEWIMGAE